jgi:hypothetical protein
MKGPFLAVDGAIFEATWQETPDGPQVSYRVRLTVGAEVYTESDIKLCKDDEEARAWLDRAAAARGFKKYTIDPRD